MSKKLKRCESCNDPINWDDTVILVEDDVYHKDCVELYPTGYFAMIDGEPIGETENDNGGVAWEYFDDHELEGLDE
ncbi:hypothetical protein F9U64_01295 [Gracilibacillus oryzae]|uniref:Uncharacterized protein n=1 Tax=Gracilibacillus oryzae TaxID=1672701 RepID=A0A7C8GVI2_9BACI|nr:hypothetical protein [Gracilibacillus oryzae]KAB8139288.1 hypothetical protein F9U64_01295 [Gracilibacillus oryzae]